MNTPVNNPQNNTNLKPANQSSDTPASTPAKAEAPKTESAKPVASKPAAPAQKKTTTKKEPAAKKTTVKKTSAPKKAKQSTAKKSPAKKKTTAKKMAAPKKAVKAAQKATKTTANTAANTGAKWLKNMDGLSGFIGKENVDFVMKSGSMLSKSMEDMGKTMLKNAQEQMDESAKISQKMMACKSLDEVTKLQQSYIQNTMSRMTKQSQLMGQSLQDFSKRAFSPVSEQYSSMLQNMFKWIV